MEIEIRSPRTTEEWEAYYDLRFRILRAPWNQPRGSERNEGDKTAFHFALFANDSVAAVARLDALNDQEMQVRFVAVDSDFQGRGFGHKIMQEAEEKAFSLNKDVFLHARENALEFYKSRGYEIIEKSYLLFDEIQHFAMRKIKG